MININKLKIQSVLFLAVFATTAQAITFNTSNLQDSSATNYVKFAGVDSEYNILFEKKVADFNGDGFDDILSLGGIVQGCVNTKCTPAPPPRYYNMEMMLFKDGEFVNHSIDIDDLSSFVNIVDIDADGDLDIVMTNGKIAINDGDADFTTTVFSNKPLANQEFFTVDWDQDDDLDIVTNKNIFINDGELNFAVQDNSIVGDNNFLVTDLNADSTPDILLLNSKGQLQTWINNGNGQLELFSSLGVENITFTTMAMMQAIDVNSDNADDLIISFSTDSVAQVKLIINDGQGNFSISDFEFPEINDVESVSIFTTKVITQDADNDGDKDLWLSFIFTTDDVDCYNYQNLLLVYENINDGLLNYKRSLHSIGFARYNIGGSSGTSVYPTVIDLNHDNRMDVVMPGDVPVAWLSDENYYFQLTDATSLQFSQHLEAVDFNADGNTDILSSGMYQNKCSVLPFSPDIHSSTYNHGSKMWLGDGKGGFSPYTTLIAGLNTFNYASEYSKFVDMNNNGQLFLISTLPALGGLPRRSVIEDPLLTDPPMAATLPEPTKLVEVADLTNNGKLEIVMLVDTEEAPIYVLGASNNPPLPTQIIAELDFGYKNGEIKLADIDDDGNIDIITNSKQEIGAIKIWYNDGNGTFTPYSAFADDIKTIVISDFDGDGKQDIMGANAGHDIWINQGNREFNKLKYDNSFWYISNPNLPLELQLTINQIPDKIESKDLNNDGLIDLIAYIDNKAQVFMNSSSNGTVSFYRNYDIDIYQWYFINPSPSNTVFSDFNNDGRMDFASNGKGFIKINIQKDEQLSTGLYYDIDRSGHGFSIDNIGRDNLYYSVFYTYDDDGKPQWFSMLNRYQASGINNFSELNNINGNSIMRYIYDYDTRSTTLDELPEYLGRLIFKGDPSNNDITQATYQIGNEYSQWPVKQIISEANKPDVDLSGIWWAGTDDAGWGISLSFVETESSQEVVVILYYYDGQGRPSWLIGQQDDFELNQEITINMQYILGYGRSDNYVELNRMDAGTITLNLNQASNDLTQAGTLSMDLFYPDDLFVINNWVRNNIPIALFSKPKN